MTNVICNDNVVVTITNQILHVEIRGQHLVGMKLTDGFLGHGVMVSAEDAKILQDTVCPLLTTEDEHYALASFFPIISLLDMLD